MQTKSPGGASARHAHLRAWNSQLVSLDMGHNLGRRKPPGKAARSETNKRGIEMNSYSTEDHKILKN